MLTSEQIAFFEAFGFLCLPGLLEDAIESISAAFEAVWFAHGGGHNGQPHTGTARSCIVPFIDQSERLSALLDDERIVGVISSLLGDDFNYLGSDGNYFAGDTGWHCDSDHDLCFIKLAFYLDALDGSNGALRVLPGSHREGEYRRSVQPRAGTPERAFGVDGSDLPGVALASKPGDVIVFNHRVMHASFKGGSWRRMFTMNCCQRFPEYRIQELQGYLARHARFLIERNVGPAMLRGADSRRMVHLEQVMANDFLLTERSRRLKHTQTEPSRH